MSPRAEKKLGFLEHWEKPELEEISLSSEVASYTNGEMGDEERDPFDYHSNI